jgi:hypothetical protein
MPRHDCLSPRRTGRAGFPHPALAGDHIQANVAATQGGQRLHAARKMAG